MASISSISGIQPVSRLENLFQSRFSAPTLRGGQDIRALFYQETGEQVARLRGQPAGSAEEAKEIINRRMFTNAQVTARRRQETFTDIQAAVLPVLNKASITRTRAAQERAGAQIESSQIDLVSQRMTQRQAGVNQAEITGTYYSRLSSREQVTGRDTARRASVIPEGVIGRDTELRGRESLTSRVGRAERLQERQGLRETSRNTMENARPARSFRDVIQERYFSRTIGERQPAERSNILTTAGRNIDIAV